MLGSVCNSCVNKLILHYQTAKWYTKLTAQEKKFNEYSSKCLELVKQQTPTSKFKLKKQLLIQINRVSPHINRHSSTKIKNPWPLSNMFSDSFTKYPITPVLSCFHLDNTVNSTIFNQELSPQLRTLPTNQSTCAVGEASHSKNTVHLCTRQYSQVSPANRKYIKCIVLHYTWLPLGNWFCLKETNLLFASYSFYIVTSAYFHCSTN